jgi:seryl-tRNA(Sec) selenium transferase
MSLAEAGPDLAGAVQPGRRIRPFLEELGVEPIIHAGGTKSSMGGSRVPDDVGEIMREALDVYVPMEELLAAVGDATARLLDVEAAAVVAGAASGCVLAAAAIRELRRDGGGDGDRDSAGGIGDRSRADVIVTQRRHYGRYTYLYEQAGCRIREVGTMNDCLRTDYEAALDHRTAGIAWLEGPGIGTAGVTLQDVCALAAACGVPVLVDAAAMAFPLDNLRDYLRAGADLVVLSGGKLVQGPQASGFVVGRADLVRRIRRLGFPHQGVGRAHKIPKEVAIGAYAALREFVARDPRAVVAEIRDRAENVAALLAARGVAATVEHNGRHALPAVVVPGVAAAARCAPSALSARLLAARPRIFVPYNNSRDEIYVEFASLEPGQDATVATTLAETVLAAHLRPDLAVVADALESSR